MDTKGAREEEEAATQTQSKGHEKERSWVENRGRANSDGTQKLCFLIQEKGIIWARVRQEGNKCTIQERPLIRA